MPTDSSPDIDVEGLVKRYGPVTALDSVSFKVNKGEVFAFVGPNGSGKTTCVEILECLRRPDSGTARVLGFDIMMDEAEIKRRIGVVPQEFSTFERLTVKENITMIADLYGRKVDINPLMEEMTLLELRDRRFDKLSGGQKRRVGIAMALVSDPEILFLDEPTTGLDPISRRESWQMIRGLRKYGKTVFLTTHYMEEVERLSDRISVIIKGKIVATGTVSDMVEKYGGGVRILIKDPDPACQRILNEHAGGTFTDEAGRLVGTFPVRKDALKALHGIFDSRADAKVELVEGTMEDVFIRVIGKRINEKGEIEEGA